MGLEVTGPAKAPLTMVFEAVITSSAVSRQLRGFSFDFRSVSNWVQDSWFVVDTEVPNHPELQTLLDIGLLTAGVLPQGADPCTRRASFHDDAGKSGSTPPRRPTETHRV